MGVSLCADRDPGAEWAMGEPGSLVTGDRAGGRSWCLRRVGMDAEWLLLEDGNEVRRRGSLREPRGLRKQGREAAGASGWER